jgi:aminopeptidase N
LYDDGHGHLVRTHRVEMDVTSDRTEVPELVGVHRGHLVLVNDDDLTYGAVRLDPASLATLVDRIADPLPRTLCWSVAWESQRRAEGPRPHHPGGRGAGRDSESGVVQRLLLHALTAVASKGEPAWAERTGWPLLSGALLDIARTAEPGSDLQLVAGERAHRQRAGRRHPGTCWPGSCPAPAPWTG